MIDQRADDLVEVLKIFDIELSEATFGKIMKADLEAFVNIAADRSAGVHVRLYSHQKYCVEALGLAVCRICLNVGNRRSEGHRPSSVEDPKSRRSVGVTEAATRRVSCRKTTA